MTTRPTRTSSYGRRESSSGGGSTNNNNNFYMSSPAIIAIANSSSSTSSTSTNSSSYNNNNNYQDHHSLDGHHHKEHHHYVSPMILMNGYNNNTTARFHVLQPQIEFWTKQSFESDGRLPLIVRQSISWLLYVASFVALLIALLPDRVGIIFATSTTWSSLSQSPQTFAYSTELLRFIGFLLLGGVGLLLSVIHIPVPDSKPFCLLIGWGFLVNAFCVKFWGWYMSETIRYEVVLTGILDIIVGCSVLAWYCGILGGNSSRD
jgi:hypothetical protein